MKNQTSFEKSKAICSMTKLQDDFMVSGQGYQGLL